MWFPPQEPRLHATMGDKSAETLGIKFRFWSVLVTFSPLPPKQCWFLFLRLHRPQHLHNIELGDRGYQRFNARQEPITRSLQLPHIPVAAYSQTDLFLVWIYLEFRSGPAGTSVTNCNHKHGLLLTCWHDVDIFTWGCIVLSSTKPAHVDWNWPISRENI